MEDDAIAQFMAVTQGNEVDARQTLQATGWDVSAAVELYFASKFSEVDADAALARSLQGSAGPGNGYVVGAALKPD